MKIETKQEEQCIVTKSTTQYICEYCGKHYKTEDRAMQCETLCRNKQELKKTEPKYRVGDIISYIDRWTEEIRYEQINSVRPNIAHTEYIYSTYEESLREQGIHSLAYSKENFDLVVKTLKKDISKDTSVPMKNIDIELRPSGKLKVSYLINFVNEQKSNKRKESKTCQNTISVKKG